MAAWVGRNRLELQATAYPNQSPRTLLPCSETLGRQLWLFRKQTRSVFLISFFFAFLSASLTLVKKKIRSVISSTAVMSRFRRARTGWVGGFVGVSNNYVIIEQIQLSRCDRCNQTTCSCPRVPHFRSPPLTHLLLQPQPNRIPANSVPLLTQALVKSARTSLVSLPSVKTPFTALSPHLCPTNPTPP